VRLALAVAAILSAVLILRNSPQEEGRPSVSVQKVVQDKSAVTGELTEMATTDQAVAPAVADNLAAIEILAQGDRAVAIEHLFDKAASFSANEKAALIDAAISIDDPRLLGLAETLALRMLNDGGAAEVLAILPKVSLFPGDSRLYAIAQESLCRFSGFPFEVVKLKFDRLFQHGRPWAAVCKNS
jgi:hypothetical protein